MGSSEASTGRRFGALPTLALSLFLAAEAANAQTVPPVAPTREEVERLTPTEPRPTPPRLTVEGGVERAPCALDRPEYQNIRFTPTAVTFEDLRGLPPEALRPAYESYLGQEQPVSVICEIRDRAATILRDAGYIASVEVPEQRIADGQVRFQVLMAKLVGVRVRGDAGRAEELIASYLQRLTGDEVFNRFTAERYLLLAGDLPGYSVRLALRSAGAARGEVIGEVTVLRTPVMVDFNVQNMGSDELGPWGAMLRGQFFGLTGLGDRTTIALFSTLDFAEQHTIQLGHDFRLGGEGLTLGGQFTYAWADPDLNDPLIDIDAETMLATIEASYPFIRSQAETVRGWVGMDLIDQDVAFNNLALTRDRLRVAFARLTADAIDTDFSNRFYNAVEPRWRLAAAVEIRQGLDLFGASEDCGPAFARCTASGAIPLSRFEGDPTATVLRSSLYGEYRPMPRLTFSLGARSQVAWEPLLAFEEFSAGNYTIGRGYDPGALLGDRGVGLQAEVRYGSAIPSSLRGLAAEGFVFLDQAWAWNEDRVLAAAGKGEVTSIGAGVRAVYGDQFRLEMMLAVPLDRVGILNQRPDPRLLISFTTRLWPWSLR